MGTNDCCCGRLNISKGTQIIGIVSAVISVLSFIGFAVRLTQLSSQEIDLVTTVRDHHQALLDSVVDHELMQDLDLAGLRDEDIEELVADRIKIQKVIIGSLMGVSVVSFVVALLLILAAKKNNRYLALPYMIWTIICTVAAGLFGIALLIAFPVITNNEELSDELTEQVVLGMVMPFVFVVVMFMLYIWWLIVVFKFYNGLKFAGGGPPRECMEMETA